MKNITKTLTTLALLLFAIQPVFAIELTNADTALNSTISTFLTTVLAGGSDFNDFVTSMMVAFCFLGIAYYAATWATQSVEIGEIIVFIFIGFMAWGFFAGYDGAMSTFWGWSDNIALGIQNEVIGTPDPIFIGSRLEEQLNMFFLNDASLFDGFQAIFTILLFRIITFILNIIIFIVSIWSMWGYGFAKLTGLIFLPLVFLPVTRPYFMKWFGILLGFWFFNLFSKIILIMYYLYFGAIFGAITEPVEYEPIADQLALFRISMHFLVGIAFLLSVGGLSAVVGGGAGSGGGRSFTALAAMITRKVALKK